MSAWERLAENRIQEAIASGELTLPDERPPLDLAEYFALPPTERIGISLLRSAGVVPPEIELLRQIAHLEARLREAEPACAQALRADLEGLQVSFRLAMERRNRSPRDP